MKYLAVALLVCSVGLCFAEDAPAPAPEKKAEEQPAPEPEKKHGMFSHVFKHMIGGTLSKGLKGGADKIKHGIGGEEQSEATPPPPREPDKKEEQTPLFKQPKKLTALCMD